MDNDWFGKKSEENSKEENMNSFEDKPEKQEPKEDGTVGSFRDAAQGSEVLGKKPFDESKGAFFDSENKSEKSEKADESVSYRFGVNAPKPVPKDESASPPQNNTNQQNQQPRRPAPPYQEQGVPRQQPSSWQPPSGRPGGQQSPYPQNRGYGNRPQPPQGYGQNGYQRQQGAPQGYGQSRYQGQQGTPQGNGQNGYQRQQGAPQQQQYNYNQQGGYPPYQPYPYGYQPQTPPKVYKKSGPKIVALILSICSVAVLLSGLVFLNFERFKNVRDSGTSQFLPTPDDKDTENDAVDPPSRDEEPNSPSIDIAEPEKETLSTTDIVAKNLDSTVVINLYETYEKEEHVGGGSGIVWTSDGYIITNAHVVYNSEEKRPFERIEVVLYDGTVIKEATVVGTDEATDLALIQVSNTGLKAAEFGDSGALKLGEKLVALGNSNSLPWTVTEGILSGKDREIYLDSYAILCIQTDAAINPGNSGGPLLNSSGQVVAINSAKYTNADNLGFAIPITEAKAIIDDLAKFGFAKGRVRLGISGVAVPDVGFKIESINKDSVLNNTEAKVGDIITAINGVKTRDHSELSTELKKYSMGDKATISLKKGDGSEQEYTVDVVFKEAKN